MKRSNLKHPIEKIVDDGLCMSCGMCSLTFQSPDNASIEITFDKDKDSFVPKVLNWDGVSHGEFLCPGKNIDMPLLAKQVHGELPDDYLLGTYKTLRVAYATNEAMRERAASGGVIPAVLTHLFETNQIDAVYTLHPGIGPYEAQGAIIRHPDELEQVHGSTYHPFNFGSKLKELVDGNERFAFVGLPCQVAALEMYKLQNQDFAKRHIITLGLFCGGVNTFKGIAYYLKGFKVNWESVRSIRYRVGPWPGKIEIKSNDNSDSRLIPRIRGNSRWNILRYVIGFQGYWMLKRCRLCPDQVNDFADIAVGDPHLPKYRAHGGKGFSAVITRTSTGEKIISTMLKNKELDGEEVGRETIINSQGYTLDNRRHMAAYMKVNRILGGTNPNIVLYPQASKNISFRHFVYACVDLIKIMLPKTKLVEACYIPIQIFEYLFITFTPSLIAKRFIKLLRNK